MSVQGGYVQVKERTFAECGSIADHSKPLKQKWMSAYAAFIHRHVGTD